MTETEWSTKMERPASVHDGSFKPDIDPATVSEDGIEARHRAELDAESLLSAALSKTRVLTRREEKTLGRQIVRARKRVRALLRAARPLMREALRNRGRGVVTPEHDFREREAVAVLNCAQRALREPRIATATGLGRRALRQFVADLSAALADYRALRDRMLRANVRLVNVLARRYRHPNLTFLDLFQEGTIGLFRAIEKYDPDRNIKFSTYATWWIWQQLGRAGDMHGSLIRTPVHWNQFRRRVSREVHGEDGPVSREDLAAGKGMDAARFETMAQTFQFVSTDGPVNEDDDRLLETVLPGDGVDPEEHALQAGLRERLEAALDQLPPREGYILRQRFGLDDDASETLGQVGVRLGVSRERVRQLESRALKQLKDVCSLQALHEYLH